LVTTCHQAGQAIISIYHQDFAITQKDDQSPVTEADHAAHHIIMQALAELTPEVPVVSEEHDTTTVIDPNGWFWLVDPLDGTKSFIKRRGDFTVNIGLIYKRRPVLGVIQLPVTGALYVGVCGAGAWKAPQESAPLHPIHVRQNLQKPLSVVMSALHPSAETQSFIDRLPAHDAVQASSSLKFCVVAEGDADIYPRFGPTMEWDTAAGQAILEAAGGLVLTPDHQPFSYAKPEFRNGFFVAYGDQSLQRMVA
jgi:3'(2'), 5'-bisphosphate nucleotidase